MFPREPRFDHIEKAKNVGKCKKCGGQIDLIEVIDRFGIDAPCYYEQCAKCWRKEQDTCNQIDVSD